MSMARENSQPWGVRMARWRLAAQVAFSALWLGPFLPQLHMFCGVAFHCHSCPLALLACPIGVLAQFSALHVFPFVAVGTLLIAGALVGSFVCGWACPFGLLQDLLAKVPVRKFSLPARLGWTRYAVLVALVLAIPYAFGEDHPFFFCRACPAGALEASLPNVGRQALAGVTITRPGPIKLAVLVAVLCGAVVVWRPWCRLLCPLGALYALCNRFSLFFLRFHPERCGGCVECRSLCRGGGRPQDRLDSLACLRCLECRNCRSISVEAAWTRHAAGDGTAQPAGG